jgi:spermidine/putrescine-binding protein
MARRVGGAKEDPGMRNLGLAALALLAGCGDAPAGGARTVHLFLWEEYISRDVLAEFEKETGIRVVEANFENEESMLAKLQQPGTHFDVVVASNETIPTLAREGLLGRLDPSRIPNLRHLDPRFVKLPYDPDGARAVPYMWGTLGIAYNSKRVPEGEEVAWSMLWDERFRGRILMFDQPTASIGAALQFRGRPLASRDDADLAAAREALLAQKPLLHSIANDEYRAYLQSEQVWVSMAWNGDAAKVARDKPEIRYAVPKEGSAIWVDNLCVLAKPCDSAAVHAFLDYVMRPEINARIAEEIAYATCNAAARARLPKGMLDDRTIYPDEATLSRCVFRPDVGEDIVKYRRVWDAVKE